jgi:hypothetical protein
VGRPCGELDIAGCELLISRSVCGRHSEVRLGRVRAHTRNHRSYLDAPPGLWHRLCLDAQPVFGPGA